MSDTRPDGETVDETRTTDAPAAETTAERREAEARAAEADPTPAAEPKVWTPDEPDASTSGDEYRPGDYSTRLYDAGEVPPAESPRAYGSGADDSATPTAVAPAATTAAYGSGVDDTAARAAGTDTETRAYSADAETRAYSPDAETVAVAPVAPVAPVQQQPIFVQAPEQPIPRGNRGAAGAIGLLAAVVFAVLYLAVAFGLSALAGTLTVDGLGQELVAALTSWALWVPVAVFFLSFWLLGAIINRGRWGAWVIFGLLVGVASYAGHIAGVLFQAPFWTLTASEGTALAQSQLLAPLAIAAFVIGRELTIWFGAWVARRGRRMTELNIEARREYERTLEAGPKLYAS